MRTQKEEVVFYFLKSLSACIPLTVTCNEIIRKYVAWKGLMKERNLEKTSCRSEDKNRCPIEIIFHPDHRNYSWRKEQIIELLKVEFPQSSYYALFYA
jgi:hypothetical protein